MADSYSKDEIEGLMYKALKSYLAEKVGGGVYRFGCRPLNSEQEDAVIVVSSLDNSQFQQGNARVNVFTNDIVDATTGATMPALARNAEIESYGDDILSALNDADSDFLFEFDYAPTTYESDELPKQHFVNFSISFKCFKSN